MGKSLPSKSLQTLLSQIIDYAGLYPPASLSLNDAIRNFVLYQKNPDAWMLSRFVIPAARLPELSKMPGHEFLPDAHLSFSIIGRGGKGLVEFIDNLQLDIADILSFRESHGNAVSLDMFETALPSSVLMDSAGALTLVNKTTDLLNKNGLTVFIEASFGEDWQLLAEKLIRTLRKVKDKHVGFKLRTGGVTADSFPSSEQVAWALAAVRNAGVPLKATAGLHHPVRHYNDSVMTRMHGFLNVFCAAILAENFNLSIEQTKAILDDEDAGDFIFGDSAFSWHDLRVNIEQIQAARRFYLSFGSCSFDDPREDMKKLGLL